MGFALSWIAVHTTDNAAVLAQLKLEPTGVVEEIPEAPLSMARLQTGWVLVIMNRSSSALDGTVDLRRLSRLGDVVACFVEEHVMVSSVALVSNGEEVWRVTHESAKGLTHLEVVGAAPPALAQEMGTASSSLQDDGRSQPDVDHHFDVPIALAQSATGYRHDECRAGEKYEVLRHLRWFDIVRRSFRAS